MLPIGSYAGLGFVTAGSIKLLGATSWFSYALMGWSIGLPAAVLLYSCSRGGTKIAERMGGTLADARLTAYAKEAAEAVGVPPPEAVYELPAREPNAFAASNLFAGSTTVAVTSGLRSSLTADELKAVLAHEMGHLQNSDVVRNMHLAIAIAGFSGIYNAGRTLLDMTARESSSSRKKDKDKDDSGGTAGIGLAMMAAGLLTQGVAHGVSLAASRDAEILADRAAARAYGAETMISALRKIDRTAASRPADLRESKEGQQFAFAMISDGASSSSSSSSSDGGTGSLANLASKGSGKLRATRRSGKLQRVADAVGRALRTHPPLDERVAALEKAAADGVVPERIEGDHYVSGGSAGSFFW